MRILIAGLPLTMGAAHQRRLEPVAIGAVHGAAEVDDPALLADRDRGREQDRRIRRQPQQLGLRRVRAAGLQLVVGARAARVPARSSASYSEAVVKSSSAQPGASRSGTRLWSSEIGSPSSMRSRWSSNSSAPGAMREQLGLVDRRRADAGRAARARSRRARASARARTGSSACWAARRARRRSRTIRGRAPSTRPSAVSSSIARRTVARLTPSSSHSQRSDGRRSPGCEGAVLDLLGDLPVDPVVERLRRLAERHWTRDYPDLWFACQGIWFLLVPHGTFRSMTVPGDRVVG